MAGSSNVARSCPATSRSTTPATRRATDPARQVHVAAGMLALSVLADSGIEHYRGSFHEPAMYLSLVSSAANALSSADGTVRREGDTHALRRAASGAALAVGVIGTGFHLYNITKRVGGLSWQNLFYAAPIGAPAALSLSGLLGLAAEQIRNTPDGEDCKIFGRPAGQVLAALTSLGLIGTVGEVSLLHFRGNFQNPAMYLPIALPPIAAVIMAEAALRPVRRKRHGAKLWLGLTAVLGILGVGFHAYGVSRAMGGWRNWRQNVIDGPPLPAPPSFSGLALAGIAALRLLEGGRR